GWAHRPVLEAKLRVEEINRVVKKGAIQSYLFGCQWRVRVSPERALVNRACSPGHPASIPRAKDSHTLARRVLLLGARSREAGGAAGSLAWEGHDREDRTQTRCPRFLAPGRGDRERQPAGPPVVPGKARDRHTPPLAGGDL